MSDVAALRIINKNVQKILLLRNTLFPIFGLEPYAPEMRIPAIFLFLYGLPAAKSVEITKIFFNILNHY